MATTGVINLTRVPDDDFWMTLTRHWSLGVASHFVDVMLCRHVLGALINVPRYDFLVT